MEDQEQAVNTADETSAEAEPLDDTAAESSADSDDEADEDDD